MLRLAQGQTDAAARSIQTLLAGIRTRPARARALAAAVEILLVADNPEQARTAAADLLRNLGTVARPLKVTINTFFCCRV